MKIILDAQVITDDLGVYALFPGAGYKFIEDMREHNVVFLDFPRVSVPRNENELESRELLLQIARSERLSGWVAREGRGDEPSDNLADYSKSRWGQNRKQSARALHTLLHKVKKGDLIVVPDDRDWGRTHVGRISSSKPITFHQRTGFGSIPYPARAVEWLGSKPWFQCSEELLRRIRIQTPFTILDRSIRKEIYDLAYSNYVLEGEFVSRFDVAANKYSSSHEALLQFLINYTAAHCEAMSRGEEGLLHRAAFVGFVTGVKDSDYVPELAMSVNSPGRIVLYAFKNVPMVAVALYALASAACTEAGGAQNITEAPAPETIEVLASPDGVEVPDDCMIEVEASVRNIVASMGAARWVEICTAVETVSREAQVSAGGKVEKP